MNTKTLTISVSAALGLILLFTPVQAEVINHTQWLVKSGDTVYSIARTLFPGDTKQQIRFRRELVKANPETFAGNASLMAVGSKLILPEFSINKTQQKPQTVTPRVAQKAVTPDPRDVIGKVVINIGNLQATNRNAIRHLSRNSEIMNGDTLKTSKNTRAQIRFKDGALISLQPNTEFKIAEYNFQGKEDGTERSVFELIKGGFRTITGLIGHRNKQNYQVRTTVATIGIRGTHYGLMLCEANSCAADNLTDGLYGGVVDGSVAADNATGQTIFNNDQYFHIASAQDVPVETLTPPPVFDGSIVASSNAQSITGDAEQLAELQSAPIMPAVVLIDNSTTGSPTGNWLETSNNANQSVTDNVNQLTTNITANLQAPAGAGTMIAFNNLKSTGMADGVNSFIRVAGNDQILLRLTPSQAAEVPFALHEEAVNPVIQGFNTHDVLVSSTAQLNDFGTSPGLNVIWGRWTGNFTATEDNIALQTRDNLHFAYSENLTPLAYLGGLTSTSHSYIAATGFGGGTLPTDTLGGVGTQASSLNITMDFLNQQMTQYTVTANTPNIMVNAGASNVAFAQLGNFMISDLGTTCNGGASQCTGGASVAFVGTQAEALISSYTLAAPDGSIAVSGAGLALSATGVPQ